MLTPKHPDDPFPLQDRNMDSFYELANAIAASRSQKSPSQSTRGESRSATGTESRRTSKTPIRRHSHTRTPYSTSQLRLSQFAKQRVMATHVENWRDDMVPVRQHRPAQHIIGSSPRAPDDASNESMQSPDYSHFKNFPSTPADSEDSFLQLLKSPTPFSPSADASSLTPPPDSQHTERQWSPVEADPDPPNIALAALPGLNMALNIATLSPSERELFSALVPAHLEDSHALNEAVRHSRTEMMESDLPDADFNQSLLINFEEHSQSTTDLDGMIEFHPKLSSNL